MIAAPPEPRGSWLLSVIVPAYNEEANIPGTILEISRVLAELDCAWELILVDDGSTDETYLSMLEAANSNSRVKAIRLSRNFGSHAAISAGLDEARGSVCIVTTADREEAPAMIPRFIERWQAGYEVVWGVRTRRTDAFVNRAGSFIFHKLFALLGMPSYARQAIGGGYFLVDRRVVDAFKGLHERNRTIIGLLFWLGFRHTHVLYEPRQRGSGKSKWSIGRRAQLAIDSFIGFSYVPIRVVSALGASIALLSLIYGLFIASQAVLSGVSVQGWPTLMVTILFLSGVQLLVTGMLGEYIWRSLDEARARPLYVVAERTSDEAASTAISTSGYTTPVAGRTTTRSARQRDQD